MMLNPAADWMHAIEGLNNGRQPFQDRTVADDRNEDPDTSSHSSSSNGGGGINDGGGGGGGEPLYLEPTPSDSTYIDGSGGFVDANAEYGSLDPNDANNGHGDEPLYLEPVVPSAKPSAAASITGMYDAGVGAPNAECVKSSLTA
jgi:hypothetical protein